MTQQTTPATAAGTWKLGDKTVHRMGFGAMRLIGFGEGRPWHRETALTVLRKAVELGVNHIDTAAFYFHDGRVANELIRAALHPYPENLVITTKVGPDRDIEGNFRGQVPADRLREQVEHNLRELGLDKLDVVNLRLGEGLELGTGSLAEHFTALAQLRDEGLIGNLGISNATSANLAQARSIAPVVCVQNRYGLTARGDDDLLLECASQDVAFVPFFGVGGADAFPGSGPSALQDARVSEVAAAHGATPAQILLAWSLRQGPNVLTIPGTGDPAHLADNVAAASIHLTEEETLMLNSKE